MQERMEMREHNDRLITGAPLTEQEIAAARSDSAQKAATTRRHRTWAEHLDQAAIDEALQTPTLPENTISQETIAHYLED
jgi:hypothetical protein